MALAITSPLPQFFDLDGEPLQGGRLYFGEVGQNPETDPVTVYWDAAATQPVAQPVPTVNGYIVRGSSTGGMPTLVYAAAAFSLTVRDRRGQLVLYVPDSSNISNDQTLLELINALRADLANTPDPAKGDDLIGVKQPITNSVATTQHAYNRRLVSVEDFGAIGDGTVGTAAMYAALQTAFSEARTGRFDLYMPPGTYDVGVNNFPFQNPANTPLLDCGGMTIWCSGPKTILRTTSVVGADVLQINALKNFRIMGFPRIEASVSGAVEGSNACSITNGYDNLHIQIDAKDMPCVDTGTVPNGGAALTLQNGTTANPCGRLVAEVIADGCRDGVGMEPDLVNLSGKASQIDVHVSARNCYTGVKVVSAAASGPIPAGMTSGLRVRGSIVDCQHPVLLQRTHGVDIDVSVNSTKTAAQKRLNPSGAPWFASDTTVDGVYIGYAKDSFVAVRGWVGDVEYKTQLGGSAPGSSGLNGATETCEIDLDLGGTATVADVNALVIGGTSIRDSRVTLSANTTAAPLPADLVSATNANRLFVGANYTGTFTGTLTGCTTSPTGSIRWSLNGDIVTLELPDILGTSNSTGATVTGLPAAIQPAASRNCILTSQNNSVDIISRADITLGTITLYNGASLTFTAAGGKGVRATTITYKR